VFMRAYARLYVCTCIQVWLDVHPLPECSSALMHAALHAYNATLKLDAWTPLDMSTACLALTALFAIMNVAH